MQWNITNFLIDLWNSIVAFFVNMYEAVFTHDYWKLYLKGIGNTLLITLAALILGTVIGVFIAMVKYINQSSGRLQILNKICTFYTTIIRGTPVMVQMLIINYMILKNVPVELKVLVAALAFGINSGAYVSEIIRGGIMSVDRGQAETARSLGLGELKTMQLIILPQALRNILPSLFNEIIALIKETSIAGFISVIDITNAGDFVRSRTWTFEPLIVSALIYLALVLGLTKVQSVFERRMAKGDRS